MTVLIDELFSVDPSLDPVARDERASLAWCDDDESLLVEHPDNIARMESARIASNLIEESEYISTPYWQLLSGGNASAITVTNYYEQGPFPGTLATRIQGTVNDTAVGSYVFIQKLIGAVAGVGTAYIKSNTGVNQDVYFKILGDNEVTVTPQWARYSTSRASSNAFTIGLRGHVTGASTLDISVYGLMLQDKEGQSDSTVPDEYVESIGTKSSDDLLSFVGDDSSFVGSIELGAGAQPYAWHYSDGTTVGDSLTGDKNIIGPGFYGVSISDSVLPYITKCTIPNNGHTGPLPDISSLTTLTLWYSYSNSHTGDLPDISGLTALRFWHSGSNDHSGDLPDTTAITTLISWNSSLNEHTGPIPDLSAQASITTWVSSGNNHDSWSGGSVSSTLATFNAADNQLSESAVNGLLVAFDAAGRTSGTISLQGGTNAAPTGAGVTAKNSLITKGWTVNTN